jgi:hypothetical protein
MGRRRRSVSNISVPDSVELVISIIINITVLSILAFISLSIILYGTHETAGVLEMIFWSCCAVTCFIIGFLAFISFAFFETMDLVIYIWIFLVKYSIVPYKVTIVNEDVKFNRWFWYSAVDLVRWKFRYYPLFGTLVCVHKHDKKRIWALEHKVVDFLIDEGAKIEIDPKEKDQLTRLQNYFQGIFKRRWDDRKNRKRS